MTIVLLTIVIPLSFLFSCFFEKKEMVDIYFDPQTSYTSKQTNVNTLVSDSGITRFKIVTATFLMYDKAAEPYWFFPHGIYVEKFDTLLNVEASIKADTAYYYQRRTLWEVIGNVDISNLEGVRFQTEHFFWNEQEQNLPFYTDSCVVVTKPDVIQKGFGGFKANKDLSYYEFTDASGEYNIEVQQRSAESDSIPAPDFISNENNVFNN